LYQVISTGPQVKEDLPTNTLITLWRYNYGYEFQIGDESYWLIEEDELQTTIEKDKDTDIALREELAAKQHKIWSAWMKWMFQQGWFNKKRNGEQTWVMPTEKVERWMRQMETPFELLSEDEKESDRMVVDEFDLLGVFKQREKELLLQNQMLMEQQAPYIKTSEQEEKNE